LITLKFWWRLDFPVKIISQTLLHRSSEKDKRFISINCLEYITIIINYFTALVFYAENKSRDDDPHPVVLCVTDNMSAKNGRRTLVKSQELVEYSQDSFADF